MYEVLSFRWHVLERAREREGGKRHQEFLEMRVTLSFVHFVLVSGK